MPAISRQSFAQLQELAHERVGLLVHQEKALMVCGRLAKRAAALGLPDLDAYCRLLRGPDGEDEMPFLINALTTNHTAFFREPHHFEHLRDHVLPAVRVAVRCPTGLVRIWSAGCSTGEEPYSIATVVRATLGMGPFPGLRILATDIDTGALAAARRGQYPSSTLHGRPVGWRSTLAANLSDDKAVFSVPDAIAELVAFRRLNLIEEWPMQCSYDAIFCRNVFIYFDESTKARTVDRFAEMLRPRGFLYLGHTEFLTARHPRLEPVGRTIYRRCG